MAKRKNVWLDVENKSRIINLFSTSDTAIDIIRALELPANTSSYRALKQFAYQHSLSVPKLSQSEINKTRVVKANLKKSPLNEEIFIENSPYQRSLVKKRALSNGYLEYKCYGKLCADSQLALTHWVGISLQLEHKNGIGDDHRIDNLELLCPNCHSLTETFAGRNKQRYENGTHGICSTCSSPSKTKTCNFCSEPKSKLAYISIEQIIREVEKHGEKIVADKYSVSVATMKNRLKSRLDSMSEALSKVQERATQDYPSTDEIIELIEKQGYVATGKQLNVSDNAVRKHLTKLLGKENLPKKQKYK